MAAVTVLNDFGVQKSKVCHCPPICHEVMGLDALMALGSSSLSVIRVVSSAYRRLLIFLPAILIPACASSSLAFLMIQENDADLMMQRYFSAYKLNKQGDNILP